MKKHLFIISILLLFLLPVSIAGAAGFSGDPDAVEKAAKSVLMLEVMKDGEVIATGSGFVAFDNKTLVTNYHVIEDAEMIKATSNDGNNYIVWYVCTADKEKDLAILRFYSPTDLQPLTLHTDVDQKAIEPVVAIGSPRGLINTATKGVVSGLFHDNNTLLIQFDASMAPGSSGGSLLNDDGEVIGVTSMSFENSQNTNFAIHIKEVQGLYDKWNGKLTDLSDFNSPTPTPVPSPTPTPRKTPTPTPRKTSTPRPAAKPPAINNVSFTNITSTKMTVCWTASSDSTSYKIYYKKTYNGNWTELKETTSKSKLFINLSPNTTYYFKIIAINKNGVQSAPYTTFKRTSAASSIPSSLLQITYKYGMTDPAIQTIKKKMQSYGYYTKGSDVSSKYNDIMVERIKHFQKNNGLKVTGQIDYAFLSKLYSGNVVKTNNYD